MVDFSLPVMGAKAASILAIIGVLGAAATYGNGVLSGYATTSDLNAHVAEFGRYVQDGIEAQIRAVENEIEILQSLSTLTPRERLRLKQLINERAFLLRKLRD